MKYCPTCKIDVATHQQSCPLCGTLLKKSDKKPTIVTQGYPKPEPIHISKVLVRIFLALSIAVSVVVALINFLTYEQSQSYWSLIVIGGLVYAWLFFRQIIHTQGSYSRRVVGHMIVISAILVTIDALTHYKGWALTYVVPLLLVLATACLTIVIVSRPAKYYRHVMSMIGLILVDCMPFVIYLLTDWQEMGVFWPSLSALSIAIFIFLTMVIIAPKTTFAEIHKQFHI